MKKILTCALTLWLVGIAHAQEWRLELKYDSIFSGEILSRTPTAIEATGGGQVRLRFTQQALNRALSVTLESNRFINKTVITLDGNSKKNTTLAPVVNWNFDRLLAINEPTQEVITATLTSNDGKTDVQNVQTTVRPSSDCLMLFADENSKPVFTYENFAGYVNENDPVIDKILKETIRMGFVKSWDGYQGGEQGVANQVYAIWRYFRFYRISYSSIATPSAESRKTFSQSVRSIEQTLNNKQANCVDGSVLMASIFRKIGLDAFLVLPPGHCYVGVLTQPVANGTGTRKGIKKLLIETTMLGQNPPLKYMLTPDPEGFQYSDMQKLATGRYEQDATKFNAGDKSYAVVNIGDARRFGIQSIQSKGSVSSNSLP